MNQNQEDRIVFLALFSAMLVGGVFGFWELLHNTNSDFTFGWPFITIYCLCWGLMTGILWAFIPEKETEKVE